MFPELHNRAQKVGQPPGTPVYTGTRKSSPTNITVVQFNNEEYAEVSGTTWSACTPTKKGWVTWIDVEGLYDVEQVQAIANYYHLHPLTVEDILHVEQRAKAEEFDEYMFITMKMLLWKDKSHSFKTESLNLVFGKNFVLSFHERKVDVFQQIRERLQSHTQQRLRQQGSDYLAYRLMDAVVDRYFLVLEGLGDKIEKIEESIISSPTQQNARTIYRLRRQLLLIRKAVWPLREVVNHLLQADHKISSFTLIYFRDVYDHIVQAIDNVETFRDMLASMLDVYLSSLTNKMNEVMKVLTMIATIFIPITFVASIYGMNFEYMPELHWHFGYPLVLCVMAIICVVMLVYFRKKHWF